MKTWKFLLSVVILITLLLNTTITKTHLVNKNYKILAGASTEDTYDNLTYETFDDYIAITGCDTSVTEIEIPTKINGLPVTRIISFEDCDNIVNLSIPDSITTIDENAFRGCTELSSIIIPESVIDVWSSSFSDTKWFKAKENANPLVIENGILISGTACFGSVTISESVTRIGNAAFRNCESITNIDIPDSVTNIGKFAFSNCRNAESITIPNSITNIDDWTFDNCKNLKNVTIPNSVTNIGNYAFDYCNTLETVTIGNSVIGIGANAFYCCFSLNNIVVSNSITKIGRYAFGATPWLENKRSENPFVIINGILIDGKSCKGDITIPDTVTSICYGAFELCENVTSVTIPNSVTDIGENAFSDCTNLKYVKIPNSVMSIGEFAFSNCSSLESVTIPSSIVSIENWAFESCDKLTDVTIPNSVTNIDDEAFEYSKNLKTIYGYIGSYAETFASNNGYEFIALGDVNSDKACDISDIVALQKWILKYPDSNISLNSSDLNDDDLINIFDLCLLKQMFLS